MSPSVKAHRTQFSFTNKDHYFQAALGEAHQAFNAILLEFGYSQKLQKYDPDVHQISPTQKYRFYG